MEPIVALSGITKDYTIGPEQVQVLKGLDLNIHQGEVVSIVGSSGSGKSTLMNILGLLDKPSAGSYRLEGKEVSDLDDKRLSTLRSQRLGFVFQQYFLLARLKAMDNVGLPLIYQGLGEREIRSRAVEALGRVGLEGLAGRRPAELSGGQQQRVAIARALVTKPALILADEPTGALDSKTSQEVIELFLRLNREEDLTIALITHDPKVAGRFPRVMEIRDGYCVE